MADDEDGLTLNTFTQPRIVYIRLGKDKTKDAIQNEIFKGVRNALKGLEASENGGKQEKNVVLLPDVDNRGIQDVAIGGDYVGLLLKDGRVCRFKCLCRNVKAPTKRKGSTSSEEPNFQVQSDEAYARRLQEQLNSRTLSTSSSFGSSGASNVAEETTFGLTEPPFRFGMSLNDSNLLESAHIPSGLSSSNAEPLAHLSESNFENLPSLVAETVGGSRSTGAQNVLGNPGEPLLSATQGSINSANSSVSSSNKSKSETSNQSSTSSEKSSTSNNVKNLIKSSSGSTGNEDTKEGSVILKSRSAPDLSSSSVRASTTDVRQSSSITNINTTRDTVQTTLSFIPRRPPPSPTVVHRTILTADPILLRTTRPVFIPSQLIIPSFPQASTSVYTFDPRRLNTTFTSRTPVRVLQRAGRRQIASPYEYRRSRERNTDSSVLRRDRGNSNLEQNVEESGSDFHYPDVEEIEWLQTENGEPVEFSHIGALHSEFILVEKHNGTLYHWPYTGEDPSLSTMETDILDSELSESAVPDVNTPKAKISPLVQELKLVDEQVIKLATHGIRCTLVTKSGKICTFYDKFMRECNNGKVPALIQQLSHPAMFYPELKDSVVSVDCSEFFSSVVTQKGKVYWWGLLPSKERQDFKQKLNKESSNSCSISVNDKVQLRKHLPGFPGALVFKSSETYGPQLGRLLSHETEEGTNQSAVKIKVERVLKPVSSQPNSGSASPVVNLTSRIEGSLLKGAASPLQLIAQEARSSSPHTSIRNQSRPETPVKTNPNVETWDVNDVVFLESESKVLGTVAAIDGPHVIVKVDNVNIPTDSSLRVFKVSELETVTEGVASENEGASTSKSIVSTSMYRGCIQSRPKCILDASRPSTSDKEVLTGVNPIAMATTSTGISILVKHKQTNKAFFIGPAIDSGNNEKVYTCCTDLTLTRGNDDACVTVESESVPSNQAALTTKSLSSETIGQKRKRPALDNDDEYDSTSSSLHPTDVGRPTLHTSPGSGVILLCDSNGCLYPRPFGTKLSEPCAIDLPPLHCLKLGQKLGYTSKCETEEKILMVFLAFREQKLIPAIQSGIVSKVQEVLEYLEQTCLKRYKGKTTISSTGIKKLAQENDSGKAWSPKPAGKENSDEVSKAPVFSQEVMDIINEHTSSNQNVLHVCCTNPVYLKNEAEESEPVEKLLVELSNSEKKTLSQGLSQSLLNSTTLSKHIEVAVLDKLLNHKVLATKFISMLEDRDAKGCTPFMLSIQCHNLKAALYILEFVSKNKGKQFGDCKISLDTMIFPPTFSGITPLHALALACTENLPASGLGNSLTVSNLPSGYTPRILLKLFQSKYPSAYRATIPPLAEAKKYPKAKTARQRLLEKATKQKESNLKKTDTTKKATLNPTSSTVGGATRAGPGRLSEGGNRIPIVNNRRESLQGMVTFSDPKELRQALIEMDKHMVSSETMVPEGGLASLVQHVLHVKLTELGNDGDDKLEMEVGIRGGVYNVSTSSGTAKISKKTQTIDSANSQQGSAEDDLICQLFARLLSYHEMATAVNKQEETVLSFFVNNSRWIKLTPQQKQRLLKYSVKLTGSQSDETTKQNRSSTPEHSKSSNDITAEIKIKGSSGSSTTLESNLLAQLDEISSSFKSLVDTLAALEGRVTEEVEGQKMETDKAANAEGPNTEGTTGTSRDLIDFNATSPEENVSEKDEVLPILIQLAQNWSCVATTILGYFPELTRESAMETSGGATDEGPRAQDGPTRFAPSKSCSIDGFVIELLANADKSVLITIVETIIKEMNKYPQELLLEVTQQCHDTGGPYTPSRLAITVGMKFLRAVVRQMSVHLSRSGVSYVDLRSRLASNSSSSTTSSSSVTFGSDQNNNVEFKQKARMILKSFSWLGIYELVQAAEATVLPVREGVAKAQAKSTGASISNNVPTHTVFPGGRYRGGRPGIRVSQYDSRSTNQEAMLRTASRIPDSNQTTPAQRCRGTRLAALTDDSSSPPRRQASSPPLSFRGYSRAHRRRASVIDSDSDTDEETGTLFRNVLDDDNEMDIEDSDSSGVAMATGLSIEHPYAWALDGRLFGTGENSSQNNLQINFTHYINNIVTPPSVHTGNCYLTRMYSRLVKEAIDLINTSQSDETTTSTDTIVTEEPVLQVLAITPDECGNILERVTSVLDVTWVWLAKVLDVVEGQLQHGEGFDTKRYLASLQRPEDSEFTPIPRSTTSIPGSTPEEYLMFLLRSHTNEHHDTLPVIDMLCYEHVVYILDSFIYCTKHWPKSQRILDRSISSISSIEGEESTSGILSTDATRANSEPGITGAHSNPRRRRNKEREDCIKFYGMNVTGKDRDEFLNNLQATLQQKSRMLVPKATWEVFTHNVGTLRLRSVEETSHGGRTRNDVENALPVTFDSVSRMSYPSPLVQNWLADEVVERWKISVDLFSRLFLADGPGAERDSFLAARAGVAGRLARFRRTIVYLRESVTADSQQGGLTFGGFGGRVGTTLSIAVKRIRLLEDTLRILGEMQPFHYSNFRAKFEGEEGSGPGVNRGFFAAVANALKADEKLPPDTTALLHEPGKLPEQSGFYAPKPFAYRDTTIRNHEQLKARRHKMFTAIGRFLGLSLWFNNTVPLNFSRHVIKFLLDRDVTWEDLIFFNADLFEGLSRMMIDAVHPLMTSERFQATYCCHFETSVGGTTEELLSDGSQIPVTPSNIFKYVRLYATKVMVGCVEEELRCMRNGLHDVIPTELLATLSPEDFQLLLSGGTTDIDISKLRSLITFTNSNGCSKDILERFKRWFWSIVQKMTPLQRQQLLYFCTGSAVLPVMNDRRDPDQDLSITVDVISGNTKALPMATTCGQRMSIPLYPSKRILKKKLLQAIQCQSYGLG